MNPTGFDSKLVLFMSSLTLAVGWHYQAFLCEEHGIHVEFNFVTATIDINDWGFDIDEDFGELRSCP